MRSNTRFDADPLQRRFTPLPRAGQSQRLRHSNMIRTANDILRSARETLDTARQGLVDVQDDPKRRMSGLRNLVVFGRAVTNVLQNLRSVRSDFDDWYGPVQKELESSHLMKFFYDLRSEILKKGDAGVGNRVHIKSLNFPVDMAKFGRPPVRACGFFIGDSVGGTGWEVEVSTGIVEKYYVDLPPEIGSAGLYFRNAPGMKSSTDPAQADVIALCAEYFSTLDAIVKRAEEFFKSSK